MNAYLTLYIETVQIVAHKDNRILGRVRRGSIHGISSVWFAFNDTSPEELAEPQPNPIADLAVTVVTERTLSLDSNSNQSSYAIKLAKRGAARGKTAFHPHDMVPDRRAAKST
jgi:hypothetical protein